MKARLNLQLLKTSTFDSGALGMLAMVLHPFQSIGHYRATILHRGQGVTDVTFEVNEQSDTMQLDIDLFEAVRKANARPEACGCQDKAQIKKVVSPRGYVLFHASSGSGYSVTVSNERGEVVFDSTRLSKGDLFAVSLLEPAVYSMTNTLGSASGVITVDLPPEADRQIKTLETVYVDVGQERFEPERISLLSSQGLVFRIQSSATRVLVEKQQRESEPNQPVIRWQKLPTDQNATSG
jgi:hypothetical protein